MIAIAPTHLTSNETIIFIPDYVDPQASRTAITGRIIILYHPFQQWETAPSEEQVGHAFRALVLKKMKV